MQFLDAFSLVIDSEGKFSNDPRDRGNWTGGAPNKGELMGTKYGISAKSYGDTLKSMGRSIKTLTLSEARQIYKIDFWGRLKCDMLPSIHRAPLFSCAVNCGTNKAIKWYQQALNVGSDGIMGPKTARAAIECTAPEDVLKKFCDLWLQHYANVAAKDSSQKVFLKGWQNRVHELLAKNY